ncbi:MAG: thioredoxin family protein [Planctomycetota bacterium]|jgi:thioredoxin 1
MPAVEKITKGNYIVKIGGSTGVYVLEFRSPICPICQQLQPVLDHISDHYSDRAKFGMVDVTEDLDLAAKHNITQIPVLVFLKDGEERKRLVAVVSPEEITTALEELIG